MLADDGELGMNTKLPCTQAGAGGRNDESNLLQDLFGDGWRQGRRPHQRHSRVAVIVCHPALASACGLPTVSGHKKHQVTALPPHAPAFRERRSVASPLSAQPPPAHAYSKNTYGHFVRVLETRLRKKKELVRRGDNDVYLEYRHSWGERRGPCRWTTAIFSRPRPWTRTHVSW